MGVRKACACDFAATTALELAEFHHRGDALDYSILAVGVRLVGCLEIYVRMSARTRHGMSREKLSGYCSSTGWSRG